MIIHNVLNSVFSSPGNVKVLRVLSKDTVGMTGRQIAKLSGINHQAAHNILSNLESLKIVKRTIAGRSHVFTLNRANFLCKKIILSVFDSETEFGRSILADIKSTLNKFCISSILFGSAARKDENPWSDLDLCVVYEGRKELLEKKVTVLQIKLNMAYGVTLAPFYITQTEFSKRAASNKPPVSNIVIEGIIISGKTIRELL